MGRDFFQKFSQNATAFYAELLNVIDAISLRFFLNFNFANLYLFLQNSVQNRRLCDCAKHYFIFEQQKKAKCGWNKAIVSVYHIQYMAGYTQGPDWEQLLNSCYSQIAGKIGHKKILITGNFCC